MWLPALAGLVFFFWEAIKWKENRTGKNIHGRRKLTFVLFEIPHDRHGAKRCL